MIAEAEDAPGAVDAALREQPDLALLDVNMPGSGLAAAWEISARLPSTRVVMLTISRDDGHLFAALRAGAAGYLLKDTSSDDLRQAVRTVAAGGNLLSPSVTKHVMERIAGQGRARPRDPRLDSLTERELAILARVGLGETNQEIGKALFISPATARTYVSRLLAKLQARDRTQLAVIAHRAGLSPDS